MITLLRHFHIQRHQVNVLDVLPKDEDLRPVDDLSRIKYYRNYIAHSADGKIECKEEFDAIWNVLENAIKRLGGEHLQSSISNCARISLFDGTIYKQLMTHLTNCRNDDGLNVSTEEFNSVLTELKTEAQQKDDAIRILLRKMFERIDNTTEHLHAVEKRLNEIFVEIQNNKSPIPHNIRASNARQVKSWIDDENHFVCIEALKEKTDIMGIESALTVTGSPGSGKTALIRHIALEFMAKGYEIVPVVSPRQIFEYHDETSKQIFVLDDACGVHAVDSIKITEWTDYEKLIEDCLSKCESRLLVSIRLPILNDNRVQDIHLIRKHVIDLHSNEFALTYADRENIFKSYFNTDYEALGVMHISLGLYEFFPLQCRLASSALVAKCEGHKTEEKTYQNLDLFFRSPFKYIIDEVSLMCKYAPVKYCVLLLCVLFNGDLPEEEVFHTEKYRYLIDICCVLCRIGRYISRKVLLDASVSLMDGYVKKVNGSIIFTHDIILDVLASFTIKHCPEILLQYADSHLFRDKIQINLPSTSQSTDPMKVSLTDEHIKPFFDRFTKELKDGNAWIMMNHNQITEKEFSELFIKYLELKDSSEIYNMFFLVEDKPPDRHKNVRLKLLNLFREFMESKPVPIDTREVLPFIASNGFQWILGKGLCKLFMFLERQIGQKLRREITQNRNKSRILAILGGKTEVYDWFLRMDETFNSSIVRRTFDFCLGYDYLRYDFICSVLSGQTEIIKYILKYTPCKKFINEDIEMSLLAYLEMGYPFGYSKCFFQMNRVFYEIMEWCKRKFTFKRKDDFSIHDYVQSIEYMWYNYLCIDDEKFNELVQSKITKELHPVLWERYKNLWNIGFSFQLATMKELIHFRCSYLELAVLIGNKEIVDVLLEMGANPNRECNQTQKSTKLLNTLPILRAASHDRVDIMKRLVEYGADLNSKQYDQCTPLIIAAGLGHIKTVRYLLENKVDINAQRLFCNTSLICASRKGHQDTVHYLLLNGADPDIRGENGTTALIEACKFRHVECVTDLLLFKSSIDTGDSNGWTALMHSAAQGHFELVCILLKHNAKDKYLDNKKSALILASQNGHLSIVSEILRHQRSSSYSNCSTGLNSKQYKISESILSFHYVEDYESYEINRALNAAFQSQHDEVIKTLIQHGANVNCKYNGQSFLQRATLTCNENIVRILLLNHADINYTGRGIAPLIQAIANGNQEITKILIDNGANTNIQNKVGEINLDSKISWERMTQIESKNKVMQFDKTKNLIHTPLICAVRFGDIKILEMLLADTTTHVNLETCDGITALMVACYLEDHRMVKILIRSGANVNI